MKDEKLLEILELVAGHFITPKAAKTRIYKLLNNEKPKPKP